MNKWAHSLLNDLFDEILKNDLNVVLLRSYTWLDDNPSGDIDLLIVPEALSRTKTVLDNFTNNTNWSKIFENQDANHTHMIYCQVSDADILYVHFDIQTALGRKGFIYCPSYKVMANPSVVGAIKTQNEIDSVTSLILHVLLDKKFVKDIYADKINAIDPGKLINSLNDIVGNKLAANITEWINEGLPDSRVVILGNKIRRYLRFKYPKNLFFPIIHKILRVSRYFLKRKGVLIAALGPDGAGKSTVIEDVRKMITIGAFPVAVIYMGKREAYLPTSKLIRMYYNQKMTRKEGNCEGDVKSQNSLPTKTNIYIDKPILGSLKEFLGLSNWFVEQWVRYLVQIRPILQQGGVVLCDRYIYDLANRRIGSVVYKKPFTFLLNAMYPTPDLTYFIWADPEVLYRRKMENTVDQNIFLINNYRTILKSIPNVSEIQTNIDPDEICHSVSNEILRVMKQK